MTTSAGVKALSRLQFGGPESPAGTPATITTRWRLDNARLLDAREIEEILEDIGVFGGGADRTAVVKLMGGLEVAAQPAAFEDIQYPLMLAAGGPNTGSADGVGSGKVFTTPLPTTAKPTLKSGTFEGGDDFEVERMEYALCTKLTLSGVAGQTLRRGMTFMGRQVQRIGAFTAATIPTTFEDILVSLGKFYLDPVGSAYGTTPVANQILGIDMTFEFKILPKFTMDGFLYYSYGLYVDHLITGKVTFEHDAAVSGSGGAKADWRAQTAKKLRVEFSGTALTTPGTAYSTKKFIVDLPLKWKAASVVGHQNGNNVVTMDFRSRYNTTVADNGKFIVVTEAASLP